MLLSHILGDFCANKGKKRKTRHMEHDFDEEDYIPSIIPPSTKLYLETLVAADHTVINFHGRRHVAQYIMTLMNIVI